MSLSQNIKRYRKAHGVSQECMGDRLHMDQSAYSRLERRCDTATDRLPQIAGALGVTPEVLRTYHETNNPSPVLGELGEVVPVEELLQQQEELLRIQAEEITCLRLQISYLQAVWHQYCRGDSSSSFASPPSSI